jgi:hypothetical protein
MLGTEANVRVLRVLSLTREPLSKSHVAKQTRLDPSGVRRAIDQLIAHGILETVGTGTQRPVRMRDVHPLAEALRALFRAEAARAYEVVQELRSVAKRIQPPPKAVWMIPAAESDDLERVEVGILTTAREVDRASEFLCGELQHTQRRTDVFFEPRGYTVADLITLSSTEEERISTAIPLLGPPPEFFLHDQRQRRPRIRNHADADRRLLTLGKAIGDRLVQDPTILERAREYIRRYLENAPPGERKEMEEWAGILEFLSPPRLRRFLVDSGSRATRLRQSLPFVAVLSRSERENLWNEVDDDERSA